MNDVFKVRVPAQMNRIDLLHCRNVVDDERFACFFAEVDLAADRVLLKGHGVHRFPRSLRPLIRGSVDDVGVSIPVRPICPC
jgi:hypothetical protein